MYKIRRNLRKIMSVLLAVLMCFGAAPISAVNVFAANYSVKTTNDLVGTANMQESDNAALIVNTQDYSVTVSNNDFKLVKSPTETTRTMVVLDRDQVPVKENESKTWKNICTIKYDKAGYLPEGTWVDVIYTLESVTLKGTVNYDYSDEAAYLEVAAGTIRGAVSASYWYANDLNSLSARTPYGTDYQWSVKVVPTNGGAISSIMMPLLFKDIDIVNVNYSEEKQTEGITLISGFDNTTWIQRGSLLTVTESGANYDATAETETNDPLSAVLTMVNKTSFKMSWRGQTCRTYIMPVSATGTYATIDKTVNKNEAGLGERIVYTIPVTFGPTNEVNEKKSVKVYDDLNEILDIATAEMSVETGGQDVTSEWNITIDGQRVNYVAKDPAGVQGDYNFKISVDITKDAELVDRLIEEGKVTIQSDKINFTNKAYLTFDDASDHSVEVDTNVPVEMHIDPKPIITLEKATKVSEIRNGKVGDVIPYTFKITNAGTMTLYEVDIKDELAVTDFTYDWSECKSGVNVMLPGEAAYATANYILTQDDINRGDVLNTATVYGTDITGVTVTDTDDAETIIKGDPDIQIIKKVDKTNLKNVAAGEVLNYTFEVTNTGNVTLTDLAFTDSRDIENLEWDASLDCLAPGGVLNGSAAYVLTQEDINAGNVLNTAAITGKAPDGSDVSDDDDVTTVIVSDPSIHLVKSTDPKILTAEESVAGHTVPYTFTVTNDGHNTLNNIYIVDDLEGVSDVVINWNTASMGSDGSMLPGETVSASAFYTLTQEDVDKEVVVNTATVFGTDPNGKEVSCPAEVTLKLAGADNARIELEKEIEYEKIEVLIEPPVIEPVILEDVQEPSDESVTDEAVNESGNEVVVGSGETVIKNAVAGMKVPFRFKITNTGHKTLYKVFITDELEGLSAISYDWSTVLSGTDTMLPGETAYATATYELTQADIDNGRIDNYAFVTGTPEKGNPVTDDGEAGTPLEQNPEIKIVKDTTSKKIENAVAGETKIPYSFLVTNTGNNTLHDVTFTDDHEVEALTWEEDLTTLEPGESVKGTASYTVTQEDIANGFVKNTAIVTGKDPQDTTVTDNDDTTSEIEQYASLTLTKTVDKEKIANAKVGDLITYEIKSTNDGNLTVNKIVFTDSLTDKGLSELDYVWPGTAGTLLPGETVTIKATYAVQQADIDAGTVVNSVGVTGIPEKPNDPDPDPVTPPEPTVTTELEQKPDLKVTKSADLTEIKDAKVGDVIQYSIIGENTGNVTLTNVVLTDKLEGIKDMKLAWDNEEATLLPGEKVMAMATYAITADDIARGNVENVVIMTGEDPEKTPHEDEDKTKTLIPSITTSASDAADGDKNVIAATASAIKDKITFKDFETKSLTVVSTVFDKETKTVLKVNGSAVTATKKVALKESSGEAEVEITFNGTGLGGKTLSVVTQVYETGTDKLIYEHNTDLSDDNESVVMTGDSKTTITGEKKVTTTPGTTTVTTRSNNSSNPATSSTVPATSTAASVKTGDDNTVKNAIVVMIVGTAVIAGCVFYLRKRRASK